MSGMKEGTVLVTSGYGGNTRQPFVEVTLPGHKSMQFDPQSARDLALSLLEGAEAAEQDAFLVEFSMKEFGVSLAQAGTLLVKARESRDKRFASKHQKR